MGEKTITPRQLTAMLFTALLPLCTEGLPRRLTAAGRGAWLAPLVAGGGILLVACLLGRGGGTLKAGVSALYASPWGRGVCPLFLLWLLFLTAAHAARIGSRLSDALMASPVVLAAGVLALGCWMGTGGLPAFARSCEIFALALAFAYGLILLFGLPRLEGSWLFLWDKASLAHIPLGSLAVAGTGAAGCCVLFLLEEVTGEGKGLLRRGAGFFLLLSLGLMLVLGRFGPALVGEIDRPFFQMVSGIGFEGAFQRLEGLASALWLLGDTALLGLLLLAGRRLLARCRGRREERGQLWLLGGAAFLGSLPISWWNQILQGDFLPFGNLFFAALGIFLLGAGGLRRKRNDMMCQEDEKTQDIVSRKKE